MKHIVIDGSYANEKIGLGIVNLYPDGVISVRSEIVLKKPRVLPRYHSLSAEFLAAAYALKNTSPGQFVCLYSDSHRVVSFINTPEKTFYISRSPGTAPLMEILRDATKGRIVKATHRNRTRFSTIPTVMFNIAHNASAVASGSSKILPTTGYPGIFSDTYIHESRKNADQPHMKMDLG